MKTIKIPFDLNKYDTEEYKIQCNNQDVRILCGDLNSPYGSIACAIKENDGYEFVRIFYKDGTNLSNYNLVLTKQVAEDGDIIYAATNNSDQAFILIYGDVKRPCLAFGLPYKNWAYKNHSAWQYSKIRLASEEETQFLFKALEKNGKKWNAETKQIENIKPTCNLKPFDKVLARNSDDSIWSIELFGKISEDNKKFECMANWQQCVPYNEETKHLLGTADGAPKKYKTW